MLKGMLRDTVDLPSPTYASCGTTAEKSAPGFAVPNSVHQVKLVSPRKLPLRCTVIWEDAWPAGKSTVSAANSTLDAPAAALAAGTATRDPAVVDAAAGDDVEAAEGVEMGEGAGTGGAAATCDVAAAGGGTAAGASCEAGVEIGAEGRNAVAGGGLAGLTGAVLAAGGGAESGDCGAGFAGARIDAVESMLGSMFRLLTSQYTAKSSAATPATTPAASQDLDSLAAGGSRRSLNGGNFLAAPSSRSESHCSTSAGRSSRSQRSALRRACHCRRLTLAGRRSLNLASRASIAVRFGNG